MLICGHSHIGYTPRFHYQRGYPFAAWRPSYHYSSEWKAKSPGDRGGMEEGEYFRGPVLGTEE